MNRTPPTLPDGFTEGSVTVAGRVIRYVEAGAGDPLVMVHGGGGLDRELGPAHALLAASRHVIAVELPGWGGSSSAGIGSVRDLGDVVAGFAAALGLETYALLGTSIGGATALWTAIDHPDAVTSLVLEAPAAFREGAPGPGDLPATRPDGTPIPRPDPEHIAYMAAITGPPTDPELVLLMPQCQVPALVLLGTQDRVFPPRFARDYARLPVATVALVHGASHNIKGDRPEAFVATVEDYLLRGPAFVVSQTSTLIRA